MNGIENPADCASRGLLPSELVDHSLWWHGPEWLQHDPSVWPRQCQLAPNTAAEESDEICLHVNSSHLEPLFSLELHSSHIRFIRVAAWIIRFTMNCRNRECGDRHTGQLAASKIRHAELHWVSVDQQEQFAREIAALKAGTGYLNQALSSL